MRYARILAVLCVMAARATAQSELPKPVVLDLTAEGGRVQSTLGANFYVVLTATAGDRIVELDPEGKNDAERVNAGARIGEWAVAPEGTLIVFSANGRLNMKPLEGDVTPIGPAVGSRLSFSTDGARISYLDLEGDAVVASLGGEEARVIPQPKGIHFCDCAVLSADGMSLFVVASTRSATEPDTIGRLDLSQADAPFEIVTRVPGERISGLQRSPDGKWLVFCQARPDRKKPEASLRMMPPGGAEVVVLARGTRIEDAVFSPSGEKIYFSSAGAAGRMQVWEVVAARDGEMRPIAEVAGHDCVRPSVGGVSVYFVVRAGEEAGRVGRVDLNP